VFREDFTQNMAALPTAAAANGRLWPVTAESVHSKPAGANAVLDEEPRWELALANALGGLAYLVFSFITCCAARAGCSVAG